MHSQLCIEIGKRVEGMRVVEPTLILTVTALDLAVVPRSIRANALVTDTEIGCRFLKEREAWAA